MATPNGLPSVAWFEWGTNGDFGRITPAVDVGAGTGVVRVSVAISNLVARQIHQCRLVVSNSLGVVQGCEQRFVTGGKIIGWGWNWDGQLNVPTGFTNAVAVGGGQMHSLALRDDGTVGVWGANVWGAICQEALAVPADLGTVEAIAAGGGGNLALRRDGTVRGWGCDEWIWVDGPVGSSNVVAIAGGDRHGLALHGDGTVTGWGESLYGETNVPVGLSNVVAIAAGANHSLALRNNGAVVAWGANWAGQTNVPVGLGNVIAIAAGGYHNLALRKDGTVVAWGADLADQTEVPIGLDNVVAIAAGGDHSLALRTDGRIVGWGDNTFGAGDAPEGPGNVVAIAAGQAHCLALGRLNTTPVVVPQVVMMESRSHFVIALEGTDQNGDLLRFRITSLPAVGRLHQYENGGLGPAILAPDTDVTDVSRRVVFVPEPDGYDDPYAGFDFVANDGEADSSAARITVRLLAKPFATTLPAAVVDGTSWMLNGMATPNGFPTAAWFEWGTINRYGRATTPVGMGSGRGVIHVRAGITNLTAGRIYRFCLVTSNEVGVTRGADQRFAVGDRVVAWGANGFGQANVPAGLADVVRLAGGYYHSLALRSDGTVVGWGYNEYGQVSVPPGLSEVVAIAGGGLHSLALRLDGTPVAWSAMETSAGRVPQGLTGVVAIASGPAHNLALRNDGSVVAWGEGGSYQTEVPAGLGNAVDVAAGRDHSLALRNDGSVVAWGTNLNGQLDVPAGLSGVVALVGGGNHSLALRNDGTVVAWGGDFYGEATVPADLSDTLAVAAGDHHSLALREDGTVVAWGRMWDGQTFVPATVPPGLSNVVAVAAGGLHNLALCVDAWPVNSVPQALDQRATGAAGQDLTLTLSGSDPDGDPVGFRITSLPQRGVLYQCADGSRGSAILAPDTGVSDPAGRVILVPERGGYGDPYTTFGFVANDGELDSIAATITIRIPPAPFSATQAPTRIRTTSATLNGMATPNGLPSLAWFEWGTNSAPSLTTPVVDVGAGWGVVRVRAELRNLAACRVYHSQLVVSNEAGVVRGQTRRFTTGGTVMAWGAGPVGLSGWPHYGQSVVPEGLRGVVTVAAGAHQSFGLREDGAAVGWGDDSFGQTTAPRDATGIEAISGGRYHTLALHSDGTVVAWGNNYHGETNVPAGFNGGIDIAAGYAHNLVLRGDGTVVAWGWNEGGQANVPAGLSNVTAIAAGELHSLALLSDGRVVTWGTNWAGQIDVPAHLEGVCAIAAGSSHSLALRQDGTVVAWGGNWAGQTNVPPDLAHVVAVVAGASHSLALREDGSVVTWGAVAWDSNGRQVPAIVPSGLANVVAVAAGMDHDVALLGPPPLLTQVQPPGTESGMFRQTGLMWQRMRVVNTSPWVSPAVRVLIQGLPPGTTVYNASGTNDAGQPYVQYNRTLAPGASADLIIEYFSSTRTMPDPMLVGEWASPADPLDPVGTVQPITRSLSLADGSYVIDFRTLADRTYYVQYSVGLLTWRTAFPPVVGTGSGMQWVDNGPPKTESHPGTQTNRFYRVLLTP